MKIKFSRNEEIILLFTDIGKSCPSRKFKTSQICLLTPFAKIKFSQNFWIYSNYKLLVLTFGLAPGGGGGTLIFSWYVGLDPASTVYPHKYQAYPKQYFKFSNPQKCFDSVPWP